MSPGYACPIVSLMPTVGMELIDDCREVQIDFAPI